MRARGVCLLPFMIVLAAALQCQPNHFGADCSVFCHPLTTCNGKGSCDSRGACVCDGGRGGPDCNHERLMCQVWGDPHVNNFAGKVYDYHQPGAHVFYEVGSTKVILKQWNCGGDDATPLSCIEQVRVVAGGVRMELNRFEIGQQDGLHGVLYVKEEGGQEYKLDAFAKHRAGEIPFKVGGVKVLAADPINDIRAQYRFELETESGITVRTKFSLENTWDVEIEHYGPTEEVKGVCTDGCDGAALSKFGNEDCTRRMWDRYLCTTDDACEFSPSEPSVPVAPPYSTCSNDAAALNWAHGCCDRFKACAGDAQYNACVEENCNMKWTGHVTGSVCSKSFTDTLLSLGLCSNLLCPAGRGGENCAECLPHFYGPSCDAYCKPEETCNGHGTCDGSGKCWCEDGFGGSALDMKTGSFVYCLPLPEIPETDVPYVAPRETSAPVTSTPTVPSTSAPFTSAPATSAPATSAPFTSAPATSAPFTSAPATSAPATSAPVTSAPATSAPATSVPTTGVPATSIPETSAPIRSTSAPDTSAPSTDVPSTPAPPTAVPCPSYMIEDGCGGCWADEGELFEGSDCVDTYRNREVPKPVVPRQPPVPEPVIADGEEGSKAAVVGPCYPDKCGNCLPTPIEAVLSSLGCGGGESVMFVVNFPNGDCKAMTQDTKLTPDVVGVIEAVTGGKVDTSSVVCGSVHLVVEIEGTKKADLVNATVGIAEAIAQNEQLSRVLGGGLEISVVPGTCFLEHAAKAVEVETVEGTVCSALSCEEGYGQLVIGRSTVCVDQATLKAGGELGKDNEDDSKKYLFFGAIGAFVLIGAAAFFFAFRNKSNTNNNRTGAVELENLVQNQQVPYAQVVDYPKQPAGFEDI